MSYTEETVGGGGAAGRDTVPGFEHCGRSTLVRLRGGDREEGEQRAEGGPARAARPQSQLFFFFYFFPSLLLLFTWSAALLAWLESSCPSLPPFSPELK